VIPIPAQPRDARCNCHTYRVRCLVHGAGVFADRKPPLDRGAVFGQLTVTGEVRSRKRGAKYRCNCACGTRGFIAKRSALESGAVKGCTRCRVKE
jgi:hypothetical protein